MKKATVFLGKHSCYNTQILFIRFMIVLHIRENIRQNWT